MDKYSYTDTRIVKLFDGEKYIKLEVPFDFIVTEEWIKKQFNDPNYSKCINWLEKKGFYLKDDKYHLDYDKDNRYIKLPQYFLNEEGNRLRFSFGNVNCASFYIPRPNIIYTSINEFPTLNKKTYVEMGNSFSHNGPRLSWVSITSLNVYRKIVEENDYKSKNGRYFFLLIKYKKMYEDYKNHTIAMSDIVDDEGREIYDEAYNVERGVRENKEIFESFTEFANIEKSLYNVNKFSL